MIAAPEVRKVQRIVLIKGYYRSSGQGFGLVLRGVVVYQVPRGGRHSVQRGLGRIQGRGCRGKGSYRVGGVIFERRSPSCRRWPTAWLVDAGWKVLLNPSGGEVEALLRRGSR